MRKGAKRYSAYEVTHSDQKEIPVGKVLIDTGWDLIRVWEFVDFADPEFSTHAVQGKRVARLCPTCVSEHDRPAGLNHEGAHGKKAPVYTPENGDD